MKKIILFLICTFCISIFGSKLQSQPQTAQWPFYLAFEDATGARDTLWFIFDETATAPDFEEPFYNGHDIQFGEVPIELNDSSFNVWILGVDSIFEEAGGPALCCMTFAPFKVEAKPIDLSYGALGDFIFADNFVLPLTLRWDSTLFTSDVAISMLSGGMNNSRMSNDYLFNYDKSGAFCMPQHPGELILPPFDWFSQEHFPLWIQLYIGECSGLAVEDTYFRNIKVYPNPASNVLKIYMEDPIQSFQIINLQGKTVLTSTQNDSESLSEIDVSTLSTGMYLLMIRSSKGQGMAKFLKD